MNLIGREQPSAGRSDQIATRRFHARKIVIEKKQIDSRRNGSHRFGYVTRSLFHGVHIKSVRNNHAVEPHLVAKQIAQDFP